MEQVQEFKEQPKFFPGSKRKLSLDGWTPLMNGHDEKRVRFDYAMPLTGESFLGMPGFIGSAFESMNKENSVEKKSTLEIELEGITLEFFATDSSPRRHNMLTSATLRNFYLERDGEGQVILHFSTTVRRDEDLVTWAHKYEGATMFASFEATQPSLKGPAADDKQMKLGEKPKELCNFGDEKIGFCVLPKGHKGAGGAHECQKQTREESARRKEAEAVASKKPRGFTGGESPARRTSPQDSWNAGSRENTQKENQLLGKSEIAAASGRIPDARNG